MPHIAAIMVLFLACAGCSTLANPAPSAEAVSIPALLADPAAYQGRIVELRGAVVVRFEANFICPELAQIDNGRSTECLWLAPGLVGEGLGLGELAQYHQKWAVLTGKFNKDFSGHMGEYGGSVTPISVQVVGSHKKGDVPPPPPEPSANNSFKPKPLRGSA